MIAHLPSLTPIVVMAAGGLILIFSLVVAAAIGALSSSGDVDEQLLDEDR